MLRISNRSATWSTGRFLSFVILALLPSIANAQSCKVLDPELQGAYAGSCIDGLAEGVGEARGVAIYRGTFHAGMKHGTGTKIWPWGDSYQGGYAKDQMEGEGRFSWSLTGSRTGEEYQGQFKADFREGIGEYRWSSGESLTSMWKADMPSSTVDPSLFDRLVARARLEAEGLIAVGRMGAVVCHSIRLGISEQEWAKGVVRSVRSHAVEIQIQSAGFYTNVLNGVELKKDAILWDASWNWKPCI